MKFTTKTHRTVGGVQWRYACVLGIDNLIAVMVEEGKEALYYIDKHGHASNAEFGNIMRYYDLIPLIQEHNLPPGIDPKFRYAAKDLTGMVDLYVTEPKLQHGMWSGTRSKISGIFPNALANISWDSGYFYRIEADKWKFVEVEE